MNEVENTARILKGQDLLVTSFWCRFGWHSWTKWGTPYQVDKRSDKFVQSKSCSHCNEYRIRKAYPFLEHL